MEKLELSEHFEDYLEVILSVADESLNARVTDIAQKLGVKKPTVNTALKVLASKDLVVYEKYKPVQLTQKGRQLADNIISKHTVLRKFFIEVLEVDYPRANSIACKIEHLLDDELVEKLVNLKR